MQCPLCISDKVCCSIPHVAGEEGLQAALRLLAAEAAPKVPSVPLLSNVFGDFLVGVDILFAFPAAKQQRREKAGRRNGTLWCSHLHKELKVFSQRNPAEVSVFALRLSLYWCASISTSPTLFLTVSLWFNISNKSAKISPIPGSWLAHCICFQEKPEGLHPSSHFGNAHDVPCQQKLGWLTDVDGSGRESELSAGAQLSHGPGFCPHSQVLGWGEPRASSKLAQLNGSFSPRRWLGERQGENSGQGPGEM